MIEQPRIKGIGRTSKAVEAMIDAISSFHSESGVPRLVLWKTSHTGMIKSGNAGKEEDGILKAANKVCREGRLCLAVAAALKYIYVRSKDTSKDGAMTPKQKSKVVQHIQALINQVNVKKECSTIAFSVVLAARFVYAMFVRVLCA